MHDDVIELRSGTYLVPDRSRPAAFTLRIDGADQSYVDLEDPRRLEFDYIQRLADLVDLMAPSGTSLAVVHVGGAGMTLPRYLAATRPRSAQIVLEPDAELTAWVRRLLPLPSRSGIKVRPIDGASGLAGVRDATMDLLVVDAFVGARVPADLTTTQFLADAARALRRTGVLAINLTDRAPFGYGRRVVAGVLETLPEVAWCAEPATLKGRRFGNVLIFASCEPLPLAQLASRAGSGPYPYRVLHGLRLRQLIGGAHPFSRTDAAPSPVPPRGALFGA